MLIILSVVQGRPRRSSLFWSDAIMKQIYVFNFFVEGRSTKIGANSCEDSQKRLHFAQFVSKYEHKLYSCDTSWVVEGGLTLVSGYPGFPLIPIIGTLFRIRNFLKNHSELFQFWPIWSILFQIWPILTNSDQSCSKFDPFCSKFDPFCSDFDKFCSKFDQFCSDFDHFPYVPITHSAWVETLKWVWGCWC